MTRRVPVVAPVGTATVRVVEVAALGVAVKEPPKVTELFAGVELKFVPVITIFFPIPATVGVKRVIVGGYCMVNVEAETALDTPLTVTKMVPLVAPVGIWTLIDVFVTVEGVAVNPPPKVTILLEALKVLNPVPVMVIVVPTALMEGVNEEMVGTIVILLAKVLLFPFGVVTVVEEVNAPASARVGTI